MGIPFTADEIARDELDRAFREVVASSSGKRVLFWMLEQCAIYQDAFAGDQMNATNYTLGLQAAGRRLIGKLDALDPKFYPMLLIEVSELKEVDKGRAQSLAEQTGTNDDDEE